MTCLLEFVLLKVAIWFDYCWLAPKVWQSGMKWKLEFSKVKGRLFTVPFFLGRSSGTSMRTLPLRAAPSGGKGYSGFQAQGWSKNFFGFEIFDSEIFWLRKIWQVFFWWLDLSRGFWVFITIWKLVLVPANPNRKHKHSISNLFFVL